MSDSPHVVFLVLDSMRKDRVSLYGHDRTTTPALERLADHATVYENAYTPAPWTLPSHCSMFTGRFPSEHGVTNGFTDRDLSLPSALPTTMDRLSEKGYRTAGFSNNPWVGKLSGLQRRFDEYVEWNLEIGSESGAGIHTGRERLYSRFHTLLGHAARQPVFLLKRRFFTGSLVSRATRWLTEAGNRSDPTYTFLNLMEAHSPYFPPRDAFEALGLDSPGVIEPRVLNTELLAYVMGKRDLSPERRRRVLEYYDASLRYQDRKVGQLLDHLESEGLYDETLLVVCADHGKTLGDHDRSGSPPHYIYDINTNVPLLVKRPGQRQGTRVSSPVELTLIHDLAVGGGARPLHSYADTARALTEDFLPHAGHSSTDVTRWRLLSDAERKYVRSESGAEFLLDRTGGTERTVSADADRFEPFRDALDARVAGLDTDTKTEDGQSSQPIGSDVETQLEDLGYLG
jgi:arylsulfatase A-like enzyme